MSLFYRAISFCFLLLGVGAHSGDACKQSVAYFSDFDDTIKSYRKETGDGQKLVQRLFRKKVYPGAPAFFSTSRQECADNRLVILTAAIGFLKPNVKNTLNKHNIPFDQLVIRESIKDPIYDYKVGKLLELLPKVTQSEIVLLGDNTNADPVVYADILNEFPNQIDAVYIHLRDAPKNYGPGIRGFLLYLEVAIHEYNQGRLAYDSLKAVVAETASAKMKDLFPEYHYCPRNFKLPLVSPSHGDLDQTLAEIGAGVRAFCSSKENLVDEPRKAPSKKFRRHK